MTGHTSNETLVHHGYLDEVLGDNADFLVVLISFVNASQEVEGAGIAQLPVQKG